MKIHTVVFIGIFCFGLLENVFAEQIKSGTFIVANSSQDIIVTCIEKNAGYTHKLYLDNNNTFLFESSEIGKEINLGKFPVKTQLIFRLDVEGGYSYYSGGPDKNPDKIPHVAIEINNDNSWTFGFEDLYGGGDNDYNDCVFSVKGGVIGLPYDDPYVSDNADNSKFYIPDAPTLTVTTSGVNVTLSWTSVPSATGYTLFYAPYPDASSIGQIDMGTQTSLSFDASGLAFYVAFQAYNSSGSSGYSNVGLLTININTSNTIPTSFTMNWLAGKTLYDVWFGSGDDSYDEACVGKISFGADGSATYVGLKNSSDGDQLSYHVDSTGELYFGNDPTDINKIVCGSTAQYIKTHYYENGKFDNVDLYFYNENEAMAYANSLTASIPPCANQL